MADFRRVVTALAVLALLSGFAVTANAQGPAFSCTASAAVPPLLRAEGLTELTGDILIQCTGSGQTGAANFQVFLGTTITSRILNSTTGASEALLLVDEPAAANVVTSGGAAAGQNVFQGTVVGNSVSFLGVPVVPPGSVGTRIFRITNVRANATTAGSGPGGTPGPVQAVISISGSTSIPLNNPTQTVGFVQKGLNFGVRKGTDTTSALSSSGLSFRQCSSLKSTSSSAVATLRFAENFATAFKTKGDASQNIPGAIFNTESGLVLPITGTATPGTTTTAGLADFGTRLRATFANIPTGVTVFVSTTQVPSSTGATASLTGSETGPFAQVPASDTLTIAGVQGKDGAAVTVAPVTLAAGTGVAVWEVQTASPVTLDSLDFNVYFAFSANAASNTPPAGVQGTVAGSFAPAPPAFSASAGAQASATLPIPRFIDTGTPVNLISVIICRTTLLFPFVTNQAGFDTGLAIANTSADPFGTTPTAGACVLNFFGANAPAAITTASVAAGTVSTVLASTSAPNFQGYVFAVCDFQLGHGFAFVSDLGARNLAMGYLALVLPEAARQGTGVSLTNGTGEILGQ